MNIVPQNFNIILISFEVLSYNFGLYVFIMELDVLVGLEGLEGFLAEQLDKLKIQLPYSRVPQERDVIVATPVGDVVHTHPRIPEKLYSF